MEVSHCTTNLEEEDGTEVRHQEEATSNQPVPEGTEIPLQRINSTHYNQDNNRLTHKNNKNVLTSHGFLNNDKKFDTYFWSDRKLSEALK